MDARLRSSLYEEAHGSPLYTAPRKNINPSTSGDRIQEEIAVRTITKKLSLASCVCFMLQELTKWVNQQLGAGGYTEQLVTDLGLDMADGITLLHLVQALGELCDLAPRGGYEPLSLLPSPLSQCHGIFYSPKYFYNWMGSTTIRVWRMYWAPVPDKICKTFILNIFFLS